MTAKFARFAILKTLPLQKYERRLRRQLRLAGKHRKRSDKLQLREYLIDDNGAYFIDGEMETLSLDGGPKYLIDGNGAHLIDSHPVIKRNESAAHTPYKVAPAPFDEARGARVEVHAQREAGLDAREMRAFAWFWIVLMAGGYFIFGLPIKDQLAFWGFSMLVLLLIWPWLGPWLHRLKHD